MVALIETFLPQHAQFRFARTITTTAERTNAVMTTRHEATEETATATRVATMVDGIIPILRSIKFMAMASLVTLFTKRLASTVLHVILA